MKSILNSQLWPGKQHNKQIREKPVLWAVTLILLLLPGLSSCRFDYSASETDDDDGRRPSYILYNSEYLIRQSDRTELVFNAEKIVFFEEDEQAELEEVTFTYQDEEGTLVSRGTADRAEIFMEREDARISGSIRISIITESTDIIAETLFWDKSEKTLSSNSRETVTLRHSDGTMITGTNFTGNLYTREFVFDGETSGSLKGSPQQKPSAENRAGDNAE